MPWQSAAGDTIAHVPEIVVGPVTVPPTLSHSVPVKAPPEAKVACIRSLTRTPLPLWPYASSPQTPGAVVRLVAVQAAKLAVLAPITAINIKATNKLVFFTNPSEVRYWNVFWYLRRLRGRAEVHRSALHRERKRQPTASRIVDAAGPKVKTKKFAYSREKPCAISEYAEQLRPSRSDQGSSPCSTQPRSPSQTPPLRRHMRRLRQLPAAASSNRTQDQRACPST